MTSSEPEFVPGIELAGRYFQALIEPVLSGSGVPYSATLIGPGSEVLGFDTERSRDHDWGPRLQVFLEPGSDPAPVAQAVDDAIPEDFLGYPTRFPRSHETEGRPRNRVDVLRLDDWLQGALGLDPRKGMATVGWLSLPTQRLAETTAGAVFHDDLGLTDIRATLAWYPYDVWRYVLLSQWGRIGQEIAFAGRCAEVGDELGSTVVAARMVRDLMRLHLLMEKRYPPYSKWLGSAFSQLPTAEFLKPVLLAAATAKDWTEREENLCRAYEFTARRHNELSLTEPVSIAVHNYFSRPFRVIDVGRITDALRGMISDPRLRAAAPIGAVDNYIDSTDALGRLELLRAATEAHIR